MGTILSTARGTINITQNRRVIDVPDEIFLLQPDEAPLIQILQKAKSKDTVNPKFTWFERDLFPKRDQINGAITTLSQTTLTVDHGNYFRAGDVIKNERTGEQMLISSISSNVLTVTRGWGVTSAAAINDDDYLLCLGNANAEGAGSPDIKSETEGEQYNYVQDIRTPFEMTDILQNSELYGGNDWKNEQLLKMIEHKVDIERAFLFGERKEDTSGSQPVRMTGGILSFISSNITTVSTTLTESIFETFLESVFAYGSNRKLLIASPKILSAISYWAKGKLQTVPKDQTYGINVKEYLSPHGTLLIAKHRLLTGSVYGGYGIALDMDKIWKRTMRGLGTKLRPNIQDNDETKRRDEYRTVAGLMLTNEACHGVIKGVSAYS